MSRSQSLNCFLNIFRLVHIVTLFGKEFHRLAALYLKWEAAFIVVTCCCFSRVPPPRVLFVFIRKPAFSKVKSTILRCILYTTIASSSVRLDSSDSSPKLRNLRSYASPFWPSSRRVKRFCTASTHQYPVWDVVSLVNFLSVTTEYTVQCSEAQVNSLQTLATDDR